MEARVLLVLVLVHGLRADVHVMKDVTLGFGQALEICREESNLSEDKMEEFFHVWADDFNFVDRELGCALQCMSHHYNLLTAESRVHRENTDKFIRSFANGEKLAEMLTTIIHTCEYKFDHEDDHCWRILHLAECVRDRCKEEGVAPDMELMVAEFIMEEGLYDEKTICNTLSCVKKGS